MNTRETEAISAAICKSGRFETGQGTCALVCMDQLGSARRKGCPHAGRVHKDLAAEIAAVIPIEELVTALGKIAENDADNLPMHTPGAMQSIAQTALEAWNRRAS